MEKLFSPIADVGRSTTGSNSKLEVHPYGPSIIPLILSGNADMLNGLISSSNPSSVVWARLNNLLRRNRGVAHSEYFQKTHPALLAGCVVR